MTRKSPNPTSTLLSNAVVGGCGMGVPPDSDPPPGLYGVVGYVPVAELRDFFQ